MNSNEKTRNQDPDSLRDVSIISSSPEPAEEIQELRSRCDSFKNGSNSGSSSIGSFSVEKTLEQLARHEERLNSF